MAEKKGYAGKIAHSGGQVVQAPFGGGTAKGGKSVVKKGNDLRTGGKK